ncbi:putative diaminopimelate epimerase DafE [Schistosoma mansoni]|uniref:putative diaminopimelate epimerase DafE n=1 Tax=Schistosoma mansoni TaxID=6183 RepID=UPI00022DC185|nr:putative diaminopimelate epimerase DafE [Schistosoma mansoni]|eukprot:XP_018651292.1 putative diaminopimelate epimerase DafE [Schistosoma mansoni]
MKSSYLRNVDYATEKSPSSMFCLIKNNVNSLSDNRCSYDNNTEISRIPIIVQKNSWSNTSPINNNDKNNNNNSNYSTHEVDSDVMNSNNNYRTLYRESLLNDNEVRSSKQNIISWGCLPSPITEPVGVHNTKTICYIFRVYAQVSSKTD